MYFLFDYCNIFFVLWKLYRAPTVVTANAIAPWHPMDFALRLICALNHVNEFDGVPSMEGRLGFRFTISWSHQLSCFLFVLLRLLLCRDFHYLLLGIWKVRQKCASAMQLWISGCLVTLTQGETRLRKQLCLKVSICLVLLLQLKRVHPPKLTPGIRIRSKSRHPWPPQNKLIELLSKAEIISVLSDVVSACSPHSFQ